MKIYIDPEFKLTPNEEITIDWLNKHKIDGCLVERKNNTTHFNLRKTGMLNYFTCLINYDEVDLEKYLEALEAALNHRCEQEEIAKQCRIIEDRIKRLLRCTGESGWLYYDDLCYPLLKDIVTFADKYPKHTHILAVEKNIPIYKQILKLFDKLKALLKELGTEEYEDFLNTNYGDEPYVGHVYFEYPSNN